LLSSGFVQTALVSDIPGLAPHTDPALLNPWGFTVSSRGEFLISDNNGGNAALFGADGSALGAPLVIPPPARSPAGATGTPTGQVLNAISDFVISEGGRSATAAVLFSTEDGTITGFNSAVDPSQAILAADQSSGGAVYKGLATGSAGGANYLYAANFGSGAVDVFDTNFALHTFFAGQFTGPNAPAGFAPFGIKNIDGILFVTYAKQNAQKHDDVDSRGNGFIDEFDTSGDFLKRFASGTAAGGTLTALNSPWGMAVAPHGFGKFGGDLLVGNFGDSYVNAFDLKPGRFLGQLEDPNGHPLVLDGGFHGPSTKGLWSIGFGNGQDGAGKRTLFFASGINDEADGLLGMANVASGKNPEDNSQGDDQGRDSPPNDPVKSLVFVPSLQINGLELLATAAITSDDIWVAGNVVTEPGMVQPVAEHFDGKSWSVVPTPSGDAAFNGVAGAASNDVWAVGSVHPFSLSSENTLIEHWDGTSWSVVPSPQLPSLSSLLGVTAPASNNVWAVGFSPSGGLVEHWDGTAWSPVSSPAFSGVSDLTGVSADSSTDVWSVGSLSTGGTTSLHWDGTSWTQIRTALLHFGGVSAVAALSPTNVWAVGTGPGTPHPAGLIEHWDGTSWSVVSSPSSFPNVNDSLVAIAAVNANDIWAVGDSGLGAFTEHWNGTSWGIVPTPSEVASLGGMTALSDGAVVAVGSGTNGSGIILTNASTPKKATTAAAPATTMAALADAALVMPAGTTIAAQSRPTPAPLDAAAVDQLFTAAAKADQPLSFARLSRRAHKAAQTGGLDVFLRGIWSSDEKACHSIRDGRGGEYGVGGGTVETGLHRSGGDSWTIPISKPMGRLAHREENR
jgi:uncharacterized protein (TIGR03118 family)